MAGIDQKLDDSYFVDLLNEYRDAGGTQEDAHRLLVSIRNSKDEAFEDRVLEISDFVAGWCRPEKRIWTKPK